MTPAERQQVIGIIDKLNDAAEEFRASRDAVRVSLSSLVEAQDAIRATIVALAESNDHQVASIDKVIAANVIALKLFNTATE